MHHRFLCSMGCVIKLIEKREKYVFTFVSFIINGDYLFYFDARTIYCKIL